VVSEKLYTCPERTPPGSRWIPIVYTLTHLSKELYLKSGGGKRLIDYNLQELILQKLFQDFQGEYFNPDQATPGLIRQLRKFLDQARIYLADQPLEQALAAFRSPTPLQPKDRDLIQLAAKYRFFLKEKELTDLPGLLSELPRFIRESRCRNFLSNFSALILDGFYYFNHLEKQIVKALADIFPQVLVAIDASSSKLAEEFRDFWREIGKNRLINNICVNNYSPPASNPGACPVSPTLRIRRAADRVEEVKDIARDIRKLMSQNPVTRSPQSHDTDSSLSQIYLVFPKLELYAPLIQELFPRYGIPYEITRGYPLPGSPPVQVCLRIVSLRLNHGRLTDWLALFSSQYPQYHRQPNTDQWREFLKVAELPEEEREKLGEFTADRSDELKLDMVDISALAGRANLKGGADFVRDWLQPILKVASNSTKGLLEPPERLYIQLYLFWLLHRELEERLPQALTPTEFREGLLYLIYRLRIPQNILRHISKATTYGARDRLLMLRRDYDALNKFCQGLGKLEAAQEVLGHKKRRLPLGELYSLLNSELQMQQYHMPSQAEDRVQIVQSLELRGLSFNYLFWGGLIEGVFPRPPEEVFLSTYVSGRQGQDLNDQKPWLFHTLNRKDEDEYLFAYAQLNTAKHITLSYPAAEGSQPNLPSPYLKELLHHSQIHPEEIGASFPGQEVGPYYTKEELLLGLAGDLEGGPEKQKQKLLWGLNSHAPKLYRRLKHLEELYRKRQSGETFSAYDGVLRPESMVRSADILRHKLHSPRKYSVSKLEDYARCPLQFFFRHVLRLEPEKELVADYPRPDLGWLIHHILEKFYRRRIQKYPAPENRRITPQNLDQAKAEMLVCSRKALENLHWPYKNLFWLQKQQELLWGLEKNPPATQAGLLAGLLEYEAKLSDFLTPAYLEVEFKGWRVGEVELSGRADRVDVSPTGYFVIYDYKVSKLPPKLSQIKKGLSFQLPIYLMALSEAEEFSAYQPGAAGYYHLGSSQEIKHSYYFGREDLRARTPKQLALEKVFVSRQRYGLFPENEFPQELAQIKSRIKQIDKLIQRGRFNPSLADEQEAGCHYCEFRMCCRRDQFRQEKLCRQLNAEEFYKPIS